MCTSSRLESAPPAGNSAVISVVAPRAAAPPKASADILRTPVPCSLTAHVMPVPMIAAVVTACATGPCRSVCKVFSG